MADGARIDGWECWVSPADGARHARSKSGGFYFADGCLSYQCGEHTNLVNLRAPAGVLAFLIRPLLSNAWVEGVDDALEDVPGADEYATAICSHANALKNPYADSPTPEGDSDA